MQCKQDYRNITLYLTITAPVHLTTCNTVRDLFLCLLDYLPAVANKRTLDTQKKYSNTTITPCQYDKTIL